MKRIITAVLCLAVPALILLNAWEGYRYNDLADRVSDLEKQQQNLLESNRDAIAQIAYESSPTRIEEKAAGKLDLGPLDQSSVTRITVSGAEVARTSTGARAGGATP